MTTEKDVNHQHPSISTRFLYAEILPMLLTEAGLKDHAQNIKTLTENAPLERTNSPKGLNKALKETLPPLTETWVHDFKDATKEDRQFSIKYMSFLRQGFQDEESINDDNFYTQINSHFWDHAISQQWVGTLDITWKILSKLLQRYMLIHGRQTATEDVEHPLETEILPLWFKYCDCPLTIVQVDPLQGHTKNL